MLSTRSEWSQLFSSLPVFAAHTLLCTHLEQIQVRKPAEASPLEKISLCLNPCPHSSSSSSQPPSSDDANCQLHFMVMATVYRGRKEADKHRLWQFGDHRAHGASALCQEPVGECCRSGLRGHSTTIREPHKWVRGALNPHLGAGRGSFH